MWRTRDLTNCILYGRRCVSLNYYCVFRFQSDLGLPININHLSWVETKKMEIYDYGLHIYLHICESVRCVYDVRHQAKGGGWISMVRISEMLLMILCSRSACVESISPLWVQVLFFFVCVRFGSRFDGDLCSAGFKYHTKKKKRQFITKKKRSFGWYVCGIKDNMNYGFSAVLKTCYTATILWYIVK